MNQMAVTCRIMCCTAFLLSYLQAEPLQTSAVNISRCRSYSDKQGAGSHSAVFVRRSRHWRKYSHHHHLNIQPAVKSTSGRQSRAQRLHVNLLVVIWMEWKEGIKRQLWVTDWERRGGSRRTGNEKRNRRGRGQEERWEGDKLERVRGEEMRKDGKTRGGNVERGESW